MPGRLWLLTKPSALTPTATISKVGQRTNFCFFDMILSSVLSSIIRLGTNLLLQTQQHQNLALAFCQRLESFADDCAGTMNLYAAEIHRFALHRDAGHIARHQQVTNRNWAARRVDFHAHSS